MYYEFTTDLNSCESGVDGGKIMERDLKNADIITSDMLNSYRNQLKDEEKSELTVEKYMRDLKKFRCFLSGRPVTKELVIQYKEELIETYAISSVNSMLAAINNFFSFMGWYHLRVRQIKTQRQVYCSEEKELTKEEYYRLIHTAKEQNKERIGLIIQTICSTGIRISELSCITVQSLRNGIAIVDCKGKYRQVLLPKKLKLLLSGYIKRAGIKKGIVFVTKRGNPLNRSNIWREMKELCCQANVKEQKVFPHNLRHLFARTYYKMEKDIAKLADLLGHSSINTTRIYIVTSGTEHKKQIERLRLVI